MITRGQNFKVEPLNIVGSSVFGRYPKISQEKTVNMLISDSWMVDYAGYEKAIVSNIFGNGTTGRATHTSTKLNRLIVVISTNVYLVFLTFNQQQAKVTYSQVILIGQLQTTQGVVYIAENNKPQILISDNQRLYVYDPDIAPGLQQPTRDGTNPISFVPGFIDFHDTYFLCAASLDTFYSPPANNTWRLSDSNNGLLWPNDAAHIGLLQTKPDNTQAVVRVPSKGNMIFVLGKTVTEPWFDVAYQLFPYQRNNSYTLDYGCLNPATVAANDQIVAWLGVNEKSGPIILYSDGGMPIPITTDGIDYLFSNMTNPSDSQAFLFRQDGHLIYHINFYTDNISLFYDFNTKRFFHATDENGNYFIASTISFFNNQYYFVSRNNGNLYAFDTIYTTYDGNEIPRIRVCKNIRNIQQEYFIVNDLGFTIESGETKYNQQSAGPIYLITQDGNKLITEGGPIDLVTEDNQYLVTQDNQNLILQQQDPNGWSYLISQQSAMQSLQSSVPRVDLSISIDGGEHFSSYDAQYLPAIGHRKNKLAWWQIGAANDLVCQFRMWGFGRFVITDGAVNIRQ